MSPQRRIDPDPPLPPDHPIGRQVSGLRLGRFDEIADRLLIRLMPRARAGPLQQPATTLRGERCPIVFDVAIDLGPDGLARIDGGLLDAMAVAPGRIWRAAGANLARRPRPPAAVVADGTVRLRIVAGDRWVTGLVLLAGRLATLGLTTVPSGQADGSSRGPSPLLVAAPHPEVLVVADRPVGSAWPADPTDLVGPLLALAGELAAVDGGPRLPLWPVLATDEGAFPHRPILG